MVTKMVYLDQEVTSMRTFLQLIAGQQYHIEVACTGTMHSTEPVTKFHTLAILFVQIPL